MKKLVIWDMDGTLIPSESIAERVVSRVVTEELGIAMSEANVREYYRGRDMTYQFGDLARRYGHELPQSFFDRLTNDWEAATEAELVPTQHAEETIVAVKALGAKVCVASNGSLHSINRSMKLVGLHHLFDDFFGADMVAKPKPAPDLFLLAANTLGVDTTNSLVVEDSTVGVRAAQAAGIDVVGFAGNHVEMAPQLAALGCPVTTDLRDVTKLARSWAIER